MSEYLCCDMSRASPKPPALPVRDLDDRDIGVSAFIMSFQRRTSIAGDRDVDNLWKTEAKLFLKHRIVRNQENRFFFGNTRYQPVAKVFIVLADTAVTISSIKSSLSIVKPFSME